MLILIREVLDELGIFAVIGRFRVNEIIYHAL